MEEIVSKMPRWKPLLRLSAEMAQNANDLAKALDYFHMELEVTDKSSAAYKELSDKIAEIKAELTTQVAESTRLKVRKPPGKGLHFDIILETLRSSVRGKAILAQLNVTSFYMPSEPSIAVLGGLPRENMVLPDQMRILPGLTEHVESDSIMTDYISTVVQTVRLIAPKSKFIFQALPGQGGGFSMASVLGSISDMISASPDIMLITLGPLEAEIYERMLEQAIAEDILLIIAAGNSGPEKPIALHGRPILQRMMVVSAVDESGLAANFSQKSGSTFWAPGVNIPVYSEQEGRADFTTRSGTTYSSAIAAGIAARLLSEKPDMTLFSILEKLRSTARIISKPDGPPVLDLAAALE